MLNAANACSSCGWLVESKYAHNQKAYMVMAAQMMMMATTVTDVHLFLDCFVDVFQKQIDIQLLYFDLAVFLTRLPS